MSISPPPFLARLELDASADERAIRRAYGRQLRQIDQEHDAAAFQKLREAYAAALQWVARRPSDAAANVSSQAAVASAVDGTVNDAVGSAGNKVPDFRVATPKASYIQNASLPPQAQQQSLPQSQPDSANADLAEVLQHSAPEDAHAVFVDFVMAMQQLVQARQQGNSRPWEAQLRTALADPRLDSLMGRRIFERAVAELLLRGWQPGHEALFLAAGDVFLWSEDYRRLHHLGFPGQRLNRAFDEYQTFRQAAVPEYLRQKEYIARLRDPRAPSDKELLHAVPLLSALWQRYPVWLPMITDIARLKQWQQDEQKVSSWTRRFTRKPAPLRSPAAAHAIDKKKSGGGWGIGWKIALVLMAFRGLAGLIPPQTPNALPSPMQAQQNLGNSILQQAEAERTLPDRIKRHLQYIPPLHVVGNPTVECEVSLYSDGTVSSVAVLKSSGLAAFDAAVVAAIRSAQPYSNMSALPKFIVSYAMLER